MISALDRGVSTHGTGRRGRRCKGHLGGRLVRRLCFYSHTHHHPFKELPLKYISDLRTPVLSNETRSRMHVVIHQRNQRNVLCNCRIGVPGTLVLHDRFLRPVA